MTFDIIHCIQLINCNGGHFKFQMTFDINLVSVIINIMFNDNTNHIYYTIGSLVVEAICIESIGIVSQSHCSIVISM